MISLLLFPFRLVLGLFGVPVKVAKVPLKVFGIRGTFAFGAGVVAGLLVAPRTGAETRRILQERWDEWQAARLASLPAGGPEGLGNLAR